MANKTLTFHARPSELRLWLITLLIIISICGVIYYNFQQQVNDYVAQSNEQISQRSRLLALMQAQLLQSKLEAIDQTLKLISSHPDFMIHPESHTYLLDHYMHNNPEMQALLHVDANGQLLFPSHPNRQLDLADRDYFKIHQRSRTETVFTAKPSLPASGHADPVVVLSRGLYDDSGQFQGVIAAVINIRTFSNALSGININAQLVSSVLHQDGEIVFRTPFTDYQVGQTLDYIADNAENDTHPATGEGIYHHENGDYQFAYQTLEKWQLRVFVAENRSLVNTRINNFRITHLRNSLWTGTALILLILLLSWLVGRRMEITQQLVESRKALQHSYQRNQAIIKAIPDLLFTIDREGFIVDFERGEDIPLLAPAENFLNRHLSEVLPDFLAQRTLQALDKAMKSGESDYYEYELLLEDKPHFFMARSSIIDETRMLVVVLDITARKQSENALQWQATHDSLTSLPNRVLFYDRLGQAITESARYKHQFCLLYMDLNNFKQVNDNHGHLNGDNLLVQVASRIQSTIRQSDTAARLAGDEFAIILSHSSFEEAQQVADKLHHALSEAFMLENGVILTISASIGIACYPLDAQTADTLIFHADNKMYLAKRTA